MYTFTRIFVFRSEYAEVAPSIPVYPRLCIPAARLSFRTSRNPSERMYTEVKQAMTPNILTARSERPEIIPNVHRS